MARNSIGEEVANRVVKEQTGSARNFRAIDGVGDKTAQAVKGVPGIRGPSDAAEKTADELAEEAGISQSRAEKVIRGGGGDPDRKPRSNTSSVSAAGIKLSHGEFKTEVSAHDAVEAKFETSLNRGIGRSQEAARADKAKRAPITTDKERWKDNKGELDFPGVDTPTADPQVLPKDLRQEQRPNTTAPDEATVSDDRAARQSVDASAPGNDGFLLEDQVEAGVDDDELNRGVLFGAQAEQRADVSASAGEVFDGVGSGSLFGERRSKATRPPEQALQDQSDGVSESNREFDRTVTVGVTPDTLGGGFTIETDDDATDRALGKGSEVVERVDRKVGLPEPTETESTDVVAEVEVGLNERENSFGYEANFLEARETDDNIFSFR